MGKLPVSIAQKEKEEEEWYMLIIYWGRSCPDALADRSHFKCCDI